MTNKCRKEWTEGLFSEEVPFHGGKVPPALFALIGEHTIFILIKSCLLFSAVDNVEQCCMVVFFRVSTFIPKQSCCYWYLCHRSHYAVLQTFCMLMFICAHLLAACVFTHCCWPHAVVLNVPPCTQFSVANVFCM